MRKIILASQSPRRKQILEWAEIPFDVIVSHADESFPADLKVEEVPVYIANAKINAVIQQHRIDENKPVVAADTVVVLQNEIIGKPENRTAAIGILERLSGKTHRVITGVSIFYKSQFYSFSETTEVEFAELSRPQIEHYVDHYQPYDKAGAYAIQEWIGITGIRSIKGDFYNVMGLPARRLTEALGNL